MSKLRIIKDLLFCFARKASFYSGSDKILFFSRFLRFIKPTPKGYFSQEGQDKIAQEVLTSLGINLDSLSIIDIGANHPITLNNTYFFEKEKSANVFNIEPNPDFIPIYKEHDRVLINFAIGNREQELDLFVPKRKLEVNYNDNVHSSLILSEIPESALGDIELKKVRVKPLGKVINPGNFNLLFIDVEGYEMNVLNGINFDQFSFDVIFIENNSLIRTPNEIRQFMKKKGYSFYARIQGLDDIYIKSLKHKITI